MNALALSVLLGAGTAAAIPSTLPVQGALANSAGLPATDGNYGATFTLYDGPSAGAAVLYTEAFAAVPVTDGRFSVHLGSVNPDANPLPVELFESKPALWVGVAVQGEPELPRQPLGAVPWAFFARSAGGLACTGCVGAAALAPSVLAPYAKTTDLADVVRQPQLAPFAVYADLPAVAKTGQYQDLVGIPDLAGFASTADLPAWASAEGSLQPGAAADLAVDTTNPRLLVAAYTWDGSRWILNGTDAGVDLARDPGHLVHWAFDACTAVDRTGNGYSGVDTGTFNCVPGHRGYGYLHPGTAFTNVRFTLTAANIRLVKAHTIATWVRRQTYDRGQTLYSLDESGANRYVLSVGQDGAVSLSLTSTVTVVAPAGSVPADTWVHVASTYDGAAVRFYVDGQLTGSVPTASLSVGVGGCFLLGEDADGTCVGGADRDVFKGTFDELHVFDRALTPVELGRVMADDLGPRPPLEVSITAPGQVRVRNISAVAQSYRVVAQGER